MSRSIADQTFGGKLLRLSSEDKLAGQTNANYSVPLNNGNFVQHVIGAIVKTVSFKHTFPNVYLGNQVFNFLYNGAPRTVTVPVGWYTAVEYSVALSALMSAVVAQPIVVSITALTQATKFFRWTATAGDILTIFTKNSVATPNPAGDLVGVSADLVGNVVNAQWTPDFGGLTNAYLCSTQIAGTHTTASSDNGESINVLCEIPITVAYGEQVFYRGNDARYESVIFPSIRNINVADMSLRTRNGDFLDLFQNDLTVVLKILQQSRFGSS